MGIGGGSAIAPLLLLATTLRPSRVSGTTLATVLVISIAGSATYASLGYLNLGLAWPIASGSVVGSVLGALTSRRLSMRLMVSIFLIILPYFALKEFWPGLAAPTIPADLLSLGLLGLTTGFVSGLLGISGASLVVPSLVAFFLIDHHVAQGMAMGVALADSLAGATVHGLRGNLDRRVLMYLAPPALLAAIAGAFLSHLLPVVALRTIFGLFMTAVWLAMLSRLVKQLLQARSQSARRRATQKASEATEGPEAYRRGVLGTPSRADEKQAVQRDEPSLPGVLTRSAGHVRSLSEGRLGGASCSTGDS